MADSSIPTGKISNIENSTNVIKLILDSPGDNPQDDMDAKLLRFQCHRLVERLRAYQVQDEESRKQQEQLEHRIKDLHESNVMVKNHWIRLDEILRSYLHRFDLLVSAQPTDVSASGSPSDPDASQGFGTSLMDVDEIENKSSKKIDLTVELVEKIYKVFETIRGNQTRVYDTLKRSDRVTDAAKSEILTLQQERARMEERFSTLQNKYTQLLTEKLSLESEKDTFDASREELETRCQDMKWSLTKKTTRLETTEQQLEDLRRRTRALEVSAGEAAARTDSAALAASSSAALAVGSQPAATTSVAKQDLQQFMQDLEHTKTIAEKRLEEINNLISQKADLETQVRSLQIDAKHVTDEAVQQSPLYKSLLDKFATFWAEYEIIAESYNQCRNRLNEVRLEYAQVLKQLQQVEDTDHNEASNLILKVQNDLNRVKQEYEMLRLEFEQHNQSTGSGDLQREQNIWKDTWKVRVEELKKENSRLKKRNKELTQEAVKLREKLGITGDSTVTAGGGPSSSSSSSADPALTLGGAAAAALLQQQVDSPASDKSSSASSLPLDVKQLKADLKKAQNEVKMRETLLKAYQSLARDQRDRAQILADEKRHRDENEELRAELDLRNKRIKVLEETHQKVDVHKRDSDETIRRLKLLEDEKAAVEKRYQQLHQQDKTISSELENVGEALDETQEQNKRLIQQLQEKEDYNLKMMNERIKLNQQMKALREENSSLDALNNTRLEQIEAYMQKVRDLEAHTTDAADIQEHYSKERANYTRILQQMRLKIADLWRNNEEKDQYIQKYKQQLIDWHKLVRDRHHVVEQDKQKVHRQQETIANLKNKLQSLEKLEFMKWDEMLNEQMKEYQEKIMCKTCISNPKDTVLTKCFHVFCSQCVKNRIETRQRKCPECQLPFGVNDVKRIYLF